MQPPIQARKLEQAALARKRVEEKKQAQLEQQHIARQRVEQAETQRLQALAARGWGPLHFSYPCALSP